GRRLLEQFQDPIESIDAESTKEVLPIATGCDADEPTKRAGEMTLVGESELVGEAGRSITRSEPFTGRLHSSGEPVREWADPVRSAEELGYIGRMESHLRGNVGNSNRSVLPRIQERSRLAHPAIARPGWRSTATIGDQLRCHLHESSSRCR